MLRGCYAYVAVIISVGVVHSTFPKNYFKECMQVLPSSIGHFGALMLIPHFFAFTVEIHLMKLNVF